MNAIPRPFPFCLLHVSRFHTGDRGKAFRLPSSPFTFSGPTWPVILQSQWVIFTEDRRSVNGLLATARKGGSRGRWPADLAVFRIRTVEGNLHGGPSTEGREIAGRLGRLY